MDRRKFLKFGGIATAGTAIVGVREVEEKKKSEPLPEFVEGQILTHQQLNALVKRINELS